MCRIYTLRINQLQCGFLNGQRFYDHLAATPVRHSLCRSHARFLGYCCRRYAELSMANEYRWRSQLVEYSWSKLRFLFGGRHHLGDERQPISLCGNGYLSANDEHVFGGNALRDQRTQHNRTTQQSNDL